MFLGNLQIVEVFQNVITFFSYALKKGIDLSDDHCVFCYLIYSLKVSLDFISDIILSYMDFL